MDRSFITDIHKRPRSQSILKAIESLGNSLGMSVIVEGVETYEELAYLQAATRIQLPKATTFARPMLLQDLPTSRAVAEPARSAAPVRDASTQRGADRRMISPRMTARRGP